MAIVSAVEMVKKAKEGHYAIPAFNTNNLEWTKSILAGIQEAKSPAIIQTSEGAAKYMGGYKMVVDMIKDLYESMGITVPVAIHLDHGTYEGAKKVIEAGFTSVMFDGSHFPFDENVEKSKEIIALAHAKGMSVEFANPEECKNIADLGVDFLAAGIGNIHGKYPANWKGLNFDQLDKINTAVAGKPLVLHGGSGIPFDQVHKAVTLGVSKVNINTELQLEFAAATRKYIEEGKDTQGKGYDPRKLLKPGFDAITAKVIDLCKAFGSAGKAN